MNVASHYNDLYKKGSPFGDDVHNLVKAILMHKKFGAVLDIGAGQGRNALFFASRGFDVTAIDLSNEAIGQIQKSAREIGVVLDTAIMDVRKYVPKKKFDVIICLFVLHHLEAGEAIGLIEKIKLWTAVGGLNVLATFTQDGDFYKVKNPNNFFYPASGEVKNLYADWQIIQWKERETKAFQKKDDGSPMINTTSFLIAQK